MLLSYSRSAALITSSLLLLLGVQQHIPLASAQEPSPPPVTSPTLPPPHNLSTPVLSLGADIPASAATNQLLTFSFNPVPSPGVTTGTPAWTF
ncbi:MAG TPA: hypothetical protein VK821_12940, partial [Dehalococcoidia bacterium]|nr:hypothetical protein [Dehalococcoidia bacterium]